MKKLQVQELAEMLKRPEIIALLSQASKPAVPAFEEWANYWLETYRLGQVKDNTYFGTYFDPINLHLIPWFGAAPIDHITPGDIQKFFNEKGQAYAIATLKNFAPRCKGIFDTAVDHGYIFKSPISSKLRLSSKIQKC